MANSDEAAVRARLNEVALRYPQAEIARRTRVPESSVSRYLKSNRIPASFLVAVARTFGVNPVWLMFGDGAAWAADVDADAGKLGAALAELVQSMTRISKLKIGALAGHRHAGSVVALHDALAVFERVRADLALRSRPTYSRILDEWQQALERRDKVVARRQATTAEQVARLCPDDALGLRHESLRGRHEYIAGNVGLALAHRRRVFHATLNTDGEISEHALSEVFAFVSNLDALGRVDEAVRYARAALLLAPGASQLAVFPRCIATYGWVLVQSGRLRAGIGQLNRAVSFAPPAALQHKCRYGLAYAMYLTGALNLRAAGSLIEPAAAYVQSVLFFSPWSSEESVVADLLARLAAQTKGQPPSPGERLGRAHLESLNGRHERALAIWKDAEEDDAARAHNPVGLDFALATMRTQLQRRAGRLRQASASLREAEAARLAAGPGVQLDLHWQRVHWRNAVALGAKGPLRRGVDRFGAFCRRRGILFEPGELPAQEDAGSSTRP